jgi:hypothetical protein
MMSFDTFSGVCGRLRSNLVASHDEIDHALTHLRTRFFGQPITLSDVTHGSTMTEVVAETILNAIVDDALESLLERRVAVRCPVCGTLDEAALVDQARAAGTARPCTEDQVDLADPDMNAPRLPVYYLLK